MPPIQNCEHILTNEQLEQIAEMAAEKAVEKITATVYQNVGKSVIGKFTWIVGAITVGIYFWLKSKGFIEFGG